MVLKFFNRFAISKMASHGDVMLCEKKSTILKNKL